MVDFTSPIPIHHQLATLLREEIAAGAYPPGVRLPTELELCDRYGVSRTPARRALGTLADEGLIVRYRRRGSFVADGRASTEELDVAEFGAWAGDEEWSRLVGAISRGAAPDAAVVPVGWVAELISLGAIAEVDPIPDPMESLWIPETLRAMWQHHGVSYAVPLTVELHGLVLRRDALGPLGGRPPRSWSELRALAVAARDLMPAVSSPVVMPAGTTGGVHTVMATWLLLAAAGGGVGGSGRFGLVRSGTNALQFLRRLIDTGLMSPDVVGLDAGAAHAELLSGRAVAGLLPRSMVDDSQLLFIGLPGSDGSETATLVSGAVGVVTTQSSRRSAALRTLSTRRSQQGDRPSPALLAASHIAPVTPQHRALSSATTDLIESVASGSATIDSAVRQFDSIARALAA